MPRSVLPDAINRQLLYHFSISAFQNFMYLDGLTWQHSGLSIEDTDTCTREQLHPFVLNKKFIDLLDPCHTWTRFFVAEAHAGSWRVSSRNRIAAASLTASSLESVNATSATAIAAINFIFVVDLYNEGVNMPEDRSLPVPGRQSLTVSCSDSVVA